MIGLIFGDTSFPIEILKKVKKKKLNGEFKENPLVKNVIDFITKDKKRSICTPFSKE